MGRVNSEKTEKISLKHEVSALKRRELILQFIREQGGASAKEMAVRFGVSEMTIRRDFHLLEEQGSVMVHYGGASLREEDPAVVDFLTRQGKLDQDKISIARRAAACIKEGDVVFLDTSTTILHMLRFLPPVRFTVVTNSLPVMSQIYQNGKIQMYMAPGIYEEQYGGSMDYSTAQYVSGFHYDKAFFGAATVDTKFGVSASREKESVVKKAVWSNADESYLLVDHTKFGKKGLFKFNEISDYTLIFTDDQVEEEIQRQIAKRGGRVEICI